MYLLVVGVGYVYFLWVFDMFTCWCSHVFTCGYSRVFTCGCSLVFTCCRCSCVLVAGCCIYSWVFLCFSCVFTAADVIAAGFQRPMHMYRKAEDVTSSSSDQLGQDKEEGQATAMDLGAMSSSSTHEGPSLYPAATTLSPSTTVNMN